MGKWIAIALLGSLAVVAGLTLGYSPMRVEGVSCGSAFQGSQDALTADLGSTLVGGFGPGNIKARCDDRRVERKPFALVLLIGGLVVGAAGGFAALIARPARDEEGSSEIPAAESGV